MDKVSSITNLCAFPISASNPIQKTCKLPSYYASHIQLGNYIPHIQNRLFCCFQRWLEVAAWQQAFTQTLRETASHRVPEGIVWCQEAAAIGSPSSARPKRQVREPGWTVLPVEWQERAILAMKLPVTHCGHWMAKMDTCFKSHRQ